ncbi:hypothetical protein Q3G72_010263 [Acer saccharum]|nr:hypothetical protein Q3G72_010263 [Acer saccharum]
MHFVQCARMRSALVRKQSSYHVHIGIMGIALYHGWELEIHVLSVAMSCLQMMLAMKGEGTGEILIVCDGTHTNRPFIILFPIISATVEVLSFSGFWKILLDLCQGSVFGAGSVNFHQGRKLSCRGALVFRHMDSVVRILGPATSYP